MDRQFLASLNCSPQKNNEPIITKLVRQIEESIVSSLHCKENKNEYARFSKGLDWIENFITKPHPELGRKGAVCPFVQSSHENQALYFCEIDTSDVSLNDFVQAILKIPEIFYATQIKNSIARDKFSLSLFVNNIPDDNYSKYIDLVHSIVKPIFMDNGLMLGEFHPNSRVTGVHSKKFNPMISHTPVFVTRTMSLHDNLFINKESSTPLLRLHELECYLKWIGNRLPSSQQFHLYENIKSIKNLATPEESHA